MLVNDVDRVVAKQKVFVDCHEPIDDPIMDDFNVVYSH